jgi:hypothetical protein
LSWDKETRLEAHRSLIPDDAFNAVQLGSGLWRTLDQFSLSGSDRTISVLQVENDAVVALQYRLAGGSIIPSLEVVFQLLHANEKKQDWHQIATE